MEKLDNKIALLCLQYAGLMQDLVGSSDAKIFLFTNTVTYYYVTNTKQSTGVLLLILVKDAMI